MRKLTSREERVEAQYLRDALVGGDVSASLKLDGDGGFAVWVHRDEDMDLAQELLAAFLIDPDDSRIRELARRAEVVRSLARVAQQARADGESMRRPSMPPDVDTEARGGAAVTFFVIVTCVMVAFATNLGEEHTAPFRFNADLVAQGEWWRLVLPIFVHLNWMHLIFNLMWMMQLGPVVERHYGASYLFFQTLLFGVGGVLAEGYITRHAAMGLSGVVYGLLGFLWVRGRFDPREPVAISQSTMIVMLVWMLLGFTVESMRMANWAHAGGLAIGMVWGAVSAGASRIKSS